MGRRHKPIMDQGPIGEFAQALRDYHEAVNLERSRPLTYEEMAEIGLRSRSGYANATNGRTLPTQALVEDYVRTLGGSDYEVLQWKKRRAAASNELVALEKRAANPHLGPERDAVPSSPENMEGVARAPRRKFKTEDIEAAASPPEKDASNGGLWSH